MVRLTLRDVLEMPVLRRAKPEVLAGAEALDGLVRWVHATELADIAPLLREGDLVLSTGIALPSAPKELDSFAQSLKDVGAAGLMLELGRRWDAVPDAFVEACKTHALPLISLTQEVKFAAITQAVGERVVDQQLAELRDAERVHDTFTELGLAEAGPPEILAAVQRLSGAAVVLESEQHRVLDYLSGPGDVADFLDNWQTRSRQVENPVRTVWDEGNQWLVTRLGSKERGWGRLVVHSATHPPQRLVALVERAAAALALHRLHHRDRHNFVRRTHHELLLSLQVEPPGVDVARRCELAGFPVAQRHFAAISIRPVGDTTTATGSARSMMEDTMAAAVHTSNELDVPALISEIDDDIRVLLSLSPGEDVDRIVEGFALRVLDRQAVVLSSGRLVTSAGLIDRTLREAQQVLNSLHEDVVSGPGHTIYRLEDVHVRGLLTLLAEDDRLRLYVNRELEQLKRFDELRATDLFATLRALLQHESKADAAESMHLSRAAFYSRLARIEETLKVRLDDVEVRTSLHVALMADELAAGQQTRHATA